MARLLTCAPQERRLVGAPMSFTKSPSAGTCLAATEAETPPAGSGASLVPPMLRVGLDRPLAVPLLSGDWLEDAAIPASPMARATPNGVL